MKHHSTKTNFLFWANCLVLLIILNSGCGLESPTLTQLPTETRFNTPTAEQPTLTLTIEPTQTNIPPTQTITNSPSPTMTNSPTSTITPNPTVTPTLRPTLAPEEVKELFQSFLQGKDNCKEPCFMGILPGVTTIAEATDIFTHLGLQAENIKAEGKNFYQIDYIYNDELGISASLIAQGPIVLNLGLKIIPDTPNAIDPQDWLGFSPKTLINRYGQPSSVDFALDWGPRTFFAMNIYFNTVDMIVEYVGYGVLHNKNGVPFICPLTTQFDIWIWMGKNPVYPPLKGVPLEKATSLTIEDFSKLITGDPDKACFTMNKNMFP